LGDARTAAFAHGNCMIELYGMSSPNVVKITIMLEETGLSYRLHYVNVFAGDQYAPQFLALSPNNKVPALLDPTGPAGQPIAVCESGAILLYLAEKTARLLPATGSARVAVLQWLMVQLCSVGPMFGQCVHFTRYAAAGNDYSVARYTSEVRRIFGVLERRLAEVPYLGGTEYSVADVATWPWIRTACAMYPWLQKATPAESLTPWPALAAWFARIAARPGVARGVEAGERFLDRDMAAFGAADAEAFDRFFNRGKFAR
jgi:GSH-dependent disulfide-bond oxidoreductase